MFSAFLKSIFFIVRSNFSNKDKALLVWVSVKLLFKRIFIKNRQAAVKLFQFNVKGADYASFNYLFTEIFCSDDYYFKAATNSPVIIDCGSNIGMATIYFKKLYPSAEIKCFEPDPAVYNLLESNISINKLANVEAWNVALFNEEKTLTFYTSDSSGILRGSINKDRGGVNEIHVKALRLSEFIKNIEHIDLLKMDVEGAEIYIVEDLEKSGQLSKPNQYIIEYHHKINKEQISLSKFLDIFEKAGYSYSIKANFHKLKSFQDILIYAYKE